MKMGRLLPLKSSFPWCTSMSSRIGSICAFLVCVSAITQSQAPNPGAAEEPRLSQRPLTSVRAGRDLDSPRQIELRIPPGTPLRIALTKRVRIAREGTPVEARVADTVYAFDQPLIPAGSKAHGHVTRVAPVPKMRRTLAMANANFSPLHEYSLTFDSIDLAGGRSLPIETTVAPGIAETVHLVSDPAQSAKKKNTLTHAAESAKQELDDKAHNLMAEVKSPGRMHRIRQFVLAQLPYRRQYLEPGTKFSAELTAPVSFGVTTRAPSQLHSLGTQPAVETTIRARLATEVSSATANRGTPIEAVITEPVFDRQHQLILPADSRILGEVTQARAASRLHRNGELRITFESITTPEGQVQPMQGNLQGVEVDRTASLKLDREGGAQATDSKSRYFSTALAISVAAAAGHPESDDGASDGISDPAARTAAGGSGFKLVGALVSLASGSKAFSSGLGFYGASVSIYSHFLARGKDVVFPKDTPVEIGFGLPHGADRSTGKK
jgi:Bacterial conjugation TrbI-like protein